ncbi:MAG: hypothetical protein RL308_656 [Bacteroidota bacterium]|jgi:hypothetical protein
MKKIVVIFILIFGFSTISLAQIKPKVKKYDSEHVCSPNCKEGKHCYKHGEMGHVCSMEGMNLNSKKHKCNPSCMSKKHCCKHGEKKHCCGEDHPMMQKEIENTEEKMDKLEEKPQK